MAGLQLMTPPVIAFPHPCVCQFYFARLLKSAFTCCTKFVVEAVCLAKAVFKLSKPVLNRCCVASICDKRASIADCRCEMRCDHAPTFFEYSSDALSD